MTYCETSAKENKNVDETFLKLVREIIQSGVVNNQLGGGGEQRDVIQITSATGQKEGGRNKPKCCSKS